MKPQIARETFKSTCIISIACSRLDRLLDVEFPSGAVYRHFSVPERTYAALLAASSKGVHFNRFIKHSFDFAQVTEERSH